MILNAKKRGDSFWVYGNGYSLGEQPRLLTQLEGDDVVYLADTPCNTRVYLEYPEAGFQSERKTGDDSPLS